jgi:hypothetical protein
MSYLELDGSLLKIPVERTPEICLELAQSDGRVIKYFSDFELTREVCLAAVTNTGYAIQFLSNVYRTTELCLAAVQSTGAAIQFLTIEERSPEICIAAVKQSPQALYYLTNEERTFATLHAAVSANGFAFDILQPHEKIFEICLAAVKRRGGALDSVPSEIITFELCIAAVNSEGLALEFVPAVLKTKEICLLAVKNSIRALKFVGDEPELLMASLDEVIKNGTPSYIATSYLTPSQLEIYQLSESKKSSEKQQKKFNQIQVEKKHRLIERYLLCLVALIAAYLVRNQEYFSLFLIAIAALMAWELSLVLLSLSLFGLLVWAVYLMPTSVAVAIGTVIITLAILYKRK